MKDSTREKRKGRADTRKEESSRKEIVSINQVRRKREIKKKKKQ